MLRTYLLAVVIIAIFVVSFGFVVPLLISAPDDLSVLLGVTLLIAHPLITWWLLKITLASMPRAYKRERKDLAKIARRFAPLLLAVACLGACSRVPVGDVGVKVRSVGTDKGVEADLLTVGYYYIGWNEQLYLFPVSMQQYVWTSSPHEGNQRDESMTFQDQAGIALNADFGIAYTFDIKRIPDIFQRYRQGPDEIRSITIRNEVRDTLVALGAQYALDEIMGPKKEEFLKRVNDTVKKDMGERGILIDRIYSVDRFRIMDQQIAAALNNKIHAVQVAELKENELRQSKADAAKAVATAEGQAQAAIASARGTAEANRLLTQSLTPELVQWQAISKWDGKLPQATGAGALPFISLAAPSQAKGD